MLRLSKKTDYALMAMKHLASDPGRRAATAREIAERYDIPIELMAKVLTRLVRSGLLVSHQGSHGGYELAQPPAATSVAAVLEAIDGPFTMTASATSFRSASSATRCAASVIGSQRSWPSAAFWRSLPTPNRRRRLSG